MISCIFSYNVNLSSSSKIFSAFGSGALLSSILRITSSIAEQEDGKNIRIQNTRQQECLKKARASVEQALLAAQLNELQVLISIDVKSAVLALDELTGELITDNILDNIFEHFCIGK